MHEYLYRYVDSYIWDYRNLIPKVTITLERYKVIRATPCGFWIDLYPILILPKIKFDKKSTYPALLEECDRKWVSNISKKRFAYPTQEEALINFKARKTRQISILSKKLAGARVALIASSRRSFK